MTPREIKAALVEKGVTQAHIARTANPEHEYSRAMVNDVINGNRRNTSIETAIAEAIGKSVAEVFPVEQPASALAS